MEYKGTLNLPKTDFPIKAKLNELEPKIISFWMSENLSEKILFSNDPDKKKFVLHDGPPYPNGDIHLGHALNKILKDIVIKFKSMEGFSSPYVPGWDCHGLPIETQLLKELNVRKSSLSVYEFRKKCAEYALKYVDLQREEFKRLGIIGKWDEPYLTLNKEYEARVIELFGILAENGYIFKSLKPIHWCPNCETALAEAEIEYEDHLSPSIFVKFLAKKIKSEKVSAIVNDKKVNFIIWTTTPWTLPSNVAIALHPQYEYSLVENEGQNYIIAKELVESAAHSMKWAGYNIIGTFKGADFEGSICAHPFIDRESCVVMDEFVTLEDGTGCVHIAPGHGEEDYKVGLKYKLPIIMPVNERGAFTDEVPEFAGLNVFKANPLIVELLEKNGMLLALKEINHQYPHCWRCKKTVIFRATAQWFVSVDHNDLRKKVIDAIEETKWYPAWGENRIKSMVKNRPDWCISRQRSWGIPIPAFYCLNCETPNYKGAFNKSAMEFVKKYGTDEWFVKEANDILPPGLKCEKCGCEKFKKETDIMDVWLESGSSHFAVLSNDLKTFTHPADLYLEGSDQHRGWFQTSLLTSVAALKKAPYKAVLTHGFTVDEKGKKMSKSLGNVINPQEVVKEYGADVLRLWVASSDFRVDVAVSKKILKQINEGFIKIRNTCRFLLSNIYDYNPDKHKVDYKNMKEIDKYILFKLENLVKKIHESYDIFEFHAIYHSLYTFCVNDLSSFYLDIIKDRLYCDKSDSLSRRSAQSAIYEILLAMIKMMAPILSFTSEDLFSYFKKIPGNESFCLSVFLEKLPSPKPEYLSKEIEDMWEKIIEVREAAYQKIEELRSSKIINQSSECDITIIADKSSIDILGKIKNDLPSIFMVSRVTLQIDKGFSVIASKTTSKKCGRCWRYLEDVEERGEFGAICGRCEKAI